MDFEDEIIDSFWCNVIDILKIYLFIYFEIFNL